MKIGDEYLTAYIYLVNSDQTRYGSIVNNLNSQKSLKNDLFPKSIVYTIDILRNYKSPRNKNKEDGPKGEDKPNPITFVQIKKGCYVSSKKDYYVNKYLKKTSTEYKDQYLNKK